MLRYQYQKDLFAQPRDTNDSTKQFRYSDSFPMLYKKEILSEFIFFLLKFIFWGKVCIDFARILEQTIPKL